MKGITNNIIDTTIRHLWVELEFTLMRQLLILVLFQCIHIRIIKHVLAQKICGACCNLPSMLLILMIDYYFPRNLKIRISHISITHTYCFTRLKLYRDNMIAQNIPWLSCWHLQMDNSLGHECNAKTWKIW